MGTLFDQPPRDTLIVRTKEIRSFLDDAVLLAQEYEINVSDVLECRKILELERKNNLYLHNGNIFDEQIGGIGVILKEIELALSS